MPPKAKITKEMIIEEAFQIARTEGVDKITARAISERLHCSTQPVLYYFSTVDEIKHAVYQHVDEYHSSYIMDMKRVGEDTKNAVALNYVRFAVEERYLFQLLFQSNEFAGISLKDLTEAEQLDPIFHVVQKDAGSTYEEAKEIFSIIFVFIHGYASMYANNEMPYDEKAFAKLLNKMFLGAVYAIKEGKDEENL